MSFAGEDNEYLDMARQPASERAMSSNLCSFFLFFFLRDIPQTSAKAPTRAACNINAFMSVIKGQSALRS